MDRNTNTFKPNVNILSWNYDFQLERGFSDRSQDSLWQLQKRYGFFQPDYYTHRSGINDRAIIFNLNGTASFYNSELNEFSNKYEIDFMSTELTENFFDSVLRIYSTIQHLDKNYTPHLLFSWENSIAVKSAIEKVKATDILIVIGYSFPDENRTVDQSLFNAMSNISEIHVQDPNAQGLLNKLREHYNMDEGQYQKHFARVDTTSFHIPNDLC